MTSLQFTVDVGDMLAKIPPMAIAMLVERLKKSGSDMVTERKLSYIIGRHSIEDVVGHPFRQAVQHTITYQISSMLSIFLEAGAGPTVVHALQNPAYFSMLIQLSFLSFAQEEMSLANAIQEATKRNDQAVNGDESDVPEYSSLIGTMKACQQQTAAFSWTDVYYEVELTIRTQLRSHSTNEGLGHNSSRGRRNAVIDTNPHSVVNRSLPFCTLRCLLISLHTLQRVPDTRILTIETDRGISTLIVWCHKLLGLNVNLEVQGCKMIYGEGPSDIFIKETALGQKSAAWLMEPNSAGKPFFTLTQQEDDPEIIFDNRARVKGFGLELLRQEGQVGPEDIQYFAHWMIAQALSLYYDGFAHAGYSDQHQQTQNPLPTPISNEYISEAGLIFAGQYLFGLPTTGKISSKDIEDTHSMRIRFSSKINWPGLVALIFTIARICPEDLASCGDMPLSIDVFKGLTHTDHGIKKTSKNDCEGLIPGFLQTFEILSRLLQGTRGSSDSIKNAVLISARGWSVYLDSLYPLDPLDIPLGAFRAKFGVPTYKEVRRMRIIDGPTNQEFKAHKEEIVNGPDRHIYFSPGINSASRGDVLTTNSENDAFLITQAFRWKDEFGVFRRIILGFREMIELCMKFRKLQPCFCAKPAFDFDDWINANRFAAPGPAEESGRLSFENLQDLESASKFQSLWPRSDSPVPRDYFELVLCRSAKADSCRTVANMYFFWVSGNSAARWVQMAFMLMTTSSNENPPDFVIRGKESCFVCAMKHIPTTDSPFSLMIL